MELWIDIFAIILGLVGLVGCIMPIIPGLPISYVGLFIMFFWGKGEVDIITGRVMIVLLIITVIVSILDYIIPAYFTKISGGSKAASRATLVGMLVGMFFTPIGMIIGAFVGALLAEIIVEGKALRHSLKPAFASFFGFLVGTGLKLITGGIILYYIIRQVIAA